jgi:hypothetical protein
MPTAPRLLSGSPMAPTAHPVGSSSDCAFVSASGDGVVHVTVESGPRLPNESRAASATT